MKSVLARVVYATFGTLTLGLGALVLVKPALALPSEAYSPVSAHLVREQGAQGVFIGILALWCLVDSELRRPVHLALLLFTALFAWIHWGEYLQARRHLLSPLLNSLPFLAFAATTPFSWFSRRARAEQASATLARESNDPSRMAT